MKVPIIINNYFFWGIVFSGKGEGRKFVELPWFQTQVQEKLGFKPYLGTLNLHVTAQVFEQIGFLEKSVGIAVTPASGYCAGVLLKCKKGRIDCGVIIPKVPKYPQNVVEIIAPVNLREKLSLVDNSKVQFEIILV